MYCFPHSIKYRIENSVAQADSAFHILVTVNQTKNYLFSFFSTWFPEACVHVHICYLYVPTLENLPQFICYMLSNTCVKTSFFPKTGFPVALAGLDLFSSWGCHWSPDVPAFASQVVRLQTTFAIMPGGSCGAGIEHRISSVPGKYYCLLSDMPIPESSCSSEGNDILSEVSHIPSWTMLWRYATHSWLALSCVRGVLIMRGDKSRHVNYNPQ